MPIADLGVDSLQLVMFGGKGGVGKTTAAAATALYLSESYNTLLISTDPAHSIADSFRISIDHRIKSHENIPNLSLYEVDAEQALEAFKKDNDKEIKKLMDTSTSFDQEDIDAFLSLPVPGIDEVMGFKTVVDLIDEAKYEKYVIDTAPTGHALRLLSSPGLFDDWVKVMAQLRWKYRYMVTRFSGKYTPDDADDFLLKMKKTIKKIQNLLRDPAKSKFVAVTIPETMAIEETRRLLSRLEAMQIEVKDIIVNNVLTSEGCQFCMQRKQSQKRYLDEIVSTFSNQKPTIIPLQPSDVSGLDSLRIIRDILFED